MKDDMSLSGIDKTGIGGIPGVSERSLIADFSQAVSCIAGKNRIERKRQKIREELIREYINSEREDTPSRVSQFLRRLRLD